MPDIATQYRIIEEGAGWLDRRTRGRLRFDGSDRVAFLQNLLTNEITSLAHRHGVYAAYLTPQGRMISDLEIFHRGDHLLAVVPSDRAKDLAARFDNLIFTEDVRVRDVSGEIIQIAVIGRDAAATIARVFSLDRAALEALAPLAQIDAGDIFIARNDDLAAGVFDLFFPAASRSDIVSRLEASGAAEISHDMAEVLRIQLGRPAFGVDMTDETIPLEAGLLDRAISMTKGCYVGQEVIVRVLHRGGGRVAKRLVRLTFGADVTESPAAGALVFADSRDVGRLTSVAFSPADDRFIALGYVHRDVAEVGRQVTVGPEGAAARAEIVGFAA